MAQKWPFSHFSANFPPFPRWGQNPFFGHFFPISGRRPDLGSVQGNRDHNPCPRSFQPTSLTTWPPTRVIRALWAQMTPKTVEKRCLGSKKGPKVKERERKSNKGSFGLVLGIANGGGGFQEGGLQMVERAAFSSRGNLLLQWTSYLKSTLRLLLRRRVSGQICYLKTPPFRNPPIRFSQPYPPLRRKHYENNSPRVSFYADALSKWVIAKANF